MSNEPSQRQRVLDIIEECGGFDGAHHKMWVIDQIVRILTDCPTVTKTKLFDGKPYTYEILGESEAYLKWVEDYCDGEDGPETYEWDEGIAP